MLSAIDILDEPIVDWASVVAGEKSRFCAPAIVETAAGRDVAKEMSTRALPLLKQRLVAMNGSIVVFFMVVYCVSFQAVYSDGCCEIMRMFVIYLMGFLRFVLASLLLLYGVGWFLVNLMGLKFGSANQKQFLFSDVFPHEFA